MRKTDAGNKRGHAADTEHSGGFRREIAETTGFETDRKTCRRARGCRPETEAKYRQALELYGTTALSCADICRRCEISQQGFHGYIVRYHRHLMLARNGIRCHPKDAAAIRMDLRCGQHPATHAKYKDAIAACDDMSYIACNVSQIAREFGLSGTNLSKQLRTHYPDVIERREKARMQLGLDDHLPRGTRSWCRKQYAEALKMLEGDTYITLQEAARRCNVSGSGLQQHLVFYHKKLTDSRFHTRRMAVKQQMKGKITGSGTLHAPRPATVDMYAQALLLYRTTLLSVRQISRQTGVSLKGFYEYLHTWHKELVCLRKGIPYEEDRPVDWSAARKYNPATAAKYAKAIARLKETKTSTTAAVAIEFGLHPDCFRAYLKEHEPELYARQGMTKTSGGRLVARQSMEKYKEPMHLYATTTDSLNAIARRCGVNSCAFRDFLKRHFPELIERRKAKMQASTVSSP